MYKELKKLLESGHKVTFRPMSKDRVKLTVQEVKQGTCTGVEVEMGVMEWAFAEQGITERLKEAREFFIG